MKQKYIDLAKKIVDEKTVLNERAAMEDELVELAYRIAGEFELSPEEFDNLRDTKRAKVGMLENNGDMRSWLRNKLEEIAKQYLKATKKDEEMESLGDVLEIVETYTARF